MLADARKALQPPEITAPPEAQAFVQDLRAQVATVYKQAMQTIELAARMQDAIRAIEEDDEEVLLLL